MQAKQVCAQLTEENDHHKAREQELVQKLEQTEQEVTRLSNEFQASKESVSFRLTQSSTPIRRGSYHGHSTPAKPLPELTQMDSLKAENVKLKRDLECVQTNMQLTSQKTQQLKKDKKELEGSVLELQALLDKVSSENDSLQTSLDQSKVALVNKLGSQCEEKKATEALAEQVSALQGELHKLQKQNIELQGKLQTELTRSLEYQDTIERIDKKVQSLKADKASSQRTLEDTQDKLITLQSEYDDLQTSKQSSNHLSSKMCELKQYYSSQIEALKQERDENERKLSSLISSIDDAQVHASTLLEEKKALESKASALEAMNIALSRENKALTRGPTTQLSELQLKYVELSEQSEEKDLSIQELQSHVAKLEAEVSDLTKKQSNLTGEAKRYKKIANQVQKALEEQENVNFGLQEFKKQSTQVREKLDRQVQELSSELAAMQDQRVLLDDVLLEKEAMLSSSQFTINIMEGENSTLISQVSSLSEMMAARNSKIESLQLQISRYDMEMGEISETIADLEIVHGSCAETKQQLEAKIEKLQERMQEAEKYENESEKSILSLRLKVKEIQDCNNCLEEINSSLQSKVEEQFTKMDDLKDSQESSEKCIDKLKLDLAIKKDLLKEAQEKITSLERLPLGTGENPGRAKLRKATAGCALKPIQNIVD